MEIGKNAIQRLSWIGTIVNSVLLGVSNLCLAVDPEVWSFPQFLGLGFPFLLSLNIIFIIIWLSMLNMRFLLPLLLTISSLFHASKYLQFTAERVSNTDKKQLKIGSLNTKLFGHWEGREFIDTALFTIREKDLDIICMQEAYILGSNKDSILSNILINTQFNDFNYHRLNQDKPFGLILFTKHTILKASPIELPNTKANMAIAYDLLINQDTVRVYNVHLQSIRFTPQDYEFLEGGNSHSKFRKSSNIYHQMSMAYGNRVKQARVIKSHMNKSPYPNILVGDLNDVPMSYTYQLLLGENRRDAFREAGKGMESTYIGLIPSLRIDYIIHDKSFYTLNYSSSSEIPSDHKLVSAELEY